MAQRRLIFRDHAVRRMHERAISVEEVRAALAGEVVESYPDDRPYPSRLIRASCSSRVLHVVAADVPSTEDTIIITVYIPDPEKWDPTFTIRRIP